MRRYVTIINGVAVGHVDTDGRIDSPDVVEVAPGVDVLGRRYVNGEFVVDVVAEARRVKMAELAAIDAAAGMPRLMRETLIAIAGANAPQKLKDHEAAAAAKRAELAAIK